MPMPMSEAEDLEEVETSLKSILSFIASIVNKPANKQSEKCLYEIVGLTCESLQGINIRINEVWKDAEATTGKVNEEYGRENARNS